MGNQNEYAASGGFTQYLYTHNESDTIREGNLSAIIVYKKENFVEHTAIKGLLFNILNLRCAGTIPLLDSSDQ